METKVTDDKDTETITTIIECSKHSKWDSVHETKQPKDQNDEKFNVSNQGR